MMTETSTRSNPFPGLRPFKSEETHLFFGRERQSDELLRQLWQNRFLAVVGTSGSGKSSLVRAGLLPALYGGFMTKAGSSWRVALFRPGDDPIGNLAQALNAPEVLGPEAEDEAIIQRTITEMTLRRSGLGLVQTVREARIPEHDNLLVVVDQFEELFRFKQRTQRTSSGDEPAAFVKLLLEATRQEDIPTIYVVLTMRSEHLGDCAQFRDLPEAINDGQFLIPRMTRDERRAAIAGPVAVAGAEMTPQLANRLLNDVGDNPDQLPILQHALMRTWDYWIERREGNEPIDLRHYEGIGGMTEALSLHADEAFDELDDEQKRIAEALFRGLTERGIRRPVQLDAVATIAGVSSEHIEKVVEVFRRPDRNFITPPAGTPLFPDTILDISHESLIRQWGRLNRWVEQEADAVDTYRRLEETAGLWEMVQADLLGTLALENALDWKAREKP
ncbi:MAG: hypothetical protein O7E52_19485, partial [Candidatus Poribacteria bacterium]|nr:hypothetical protein [Candidatus Poribacteria bacterium]